MDMRTLKKLDAMDIYNSNKAEWDKLYKIESLFQMPGMNSSNSTNSTNCSEKCKVDCLFVPGNFSQVLGCLRDTCGCSEFNNTEATISHVVEAHDEIQEKIAEAAHEV